MSKPTLFILDVPEFAPIVVALNGRAGVTMRKHGAYWEFQGEGGITVERAGVGEAIWFGALTAGFEGRIAEFSTERLWIVAD